MKNISIRVAILIKQCLYNFQFTKDFNLKLTTKTSQYLDLVRIKLFYWLFY